MRQGDKGLFGTGMFGVKEAGDKAGLMPKGFGGDRAALRSYLKTCEREIGDFKNKENAERARVASEKKARMFLKQEEELMKSLFRKGKR